MGGPGGSGKSTLTRHLVAHLAAGVPWFGVGVSRPLRIGFVENEGPKEPFQDSIAELAEHWDGPDFLDNVAFYNEPWGSFTLADEGIRVDLRAFARENELDLFVGGPLGLLGMRGAGTPEETRAFLELLVEVGYRRDLAFLLLHHVNKGRHPSIVQALSGDWGGHPDLILGVDRYPHRARCTRVIFGKVRFGDAGKPALILDWLPSGEGIGYRLFDAPSVTPAETSAANRARILDAIFAGAVDVDAIAKTAGVTAPTVRKHLRALETDGRLTLTTGRNNALRVASAVRDEDLDGADEALFEDQPLSAAQSRPEWS
jgi:hypothetical protein